jgi:RNA polymerase sigma-70 factor (ECF subfamily)
MNKGMEIDRAIIAKAAAGDQKAFEILIRACEARVHGLAWRMTFDREDSMDLAQEVFLHIYRNLHKFDTTQDFLPWLYRVATNYIINRLKKKRLPSASLNLVMEKGEISAKSAEPHENAELAEEVGMLKAALNEIPAEYATAVALRYDKDLSVAEIAEILDISESNVKIRLFRARDMLRKIMEKRVTDNDKTCNK